MQHEVHWIDRDHCGELELKMIQPDDNLEFEIYPGQYIAFIDKRDDDDLSGLSILNHKVGSTLLELVNEKKSGELLEELNEFMRDLMQEIREKDGFSSEDADE